MRQHLLLLLRCLSHRTGLVLSDWTGSDKSTWTEVAAFNLLNIFLTNEIHDWGLVLLFWLGWVMKCRSWTEEEKSPYPVGGRLMCFVKSCLVFSLKPGGRKNPGSTWQISVLCVWYTARIYTTLCLTVLVPPVVPVPQQWTSLQVTSTHLNLTSVMAQIQWQIMLLLFFLSFPPKVLQVIKAHRTADQK